MEPTQVGIVKELNLYPVKSMGGHTVSEVFLNWHGCDGDRKYAFVQSDSKSDFPWLTARQVPKMLHYTPYFFDPANRAKSAIGVKTPDGEDFAVDSAELVQSLAAHFTDRFHLIRLSIGAFDDFPVSLVSTATLAGLSEKVGFPVTSNRFRPNIVLEPLQPVDMIENEWVGRALSFGTTDPDAAKMTVSLRDPRCVMVNYDRETLKQTPELLKEIAQQRSNCTGVFGPTLQTGTIKVGDPVFLI